MAKHRRNSEEDDEVSFDDAIRALRRWYHREVSDWADGYDKQIKKGEFSDREEFIERFDEETDSAQVIIYTMKAKAVLLASDNEDAYEDEIGEAAPTVEAAALMAFRRDIMESMDSDIDDDDTFSDEDEEDDDE